MRKIFLTIDTATVADQNKELLEAFYKTDLVEDIEEKYNTEGMLHWEVAQLISFSVKVADKVVTKTVFERDDEGSLLVALKKILDHDSVVNGVLVGHNILWFTIPFLAKRFAVNNIPLPQVLRIGGKKPREVMMKDTMLMWRMWGWRTTGLSVLMNLFGMEDTREPSEVVSKMFHNKEYHKLTNRSKESVENVEKIYNKLVELWF